MNAFERLVLVPLANLTTANLQRSLALGLITTTGLAFLSMYLMGFWNHVYQVWFIIPIIMGGGCLLLITWGRDYYSVPGVARRGDLTMMRVLGEMGFDLGRPFQGMTPLHWAVSFGHRGVVEYLIGQKVNLETPSSNVPDTPITALHMALLTDNLELARMLLQAGANPEGNPEAPYAPLHCCGFRKLPAGATLLLDFKAKINAPRGNFGTPLHAAIDCPDLYSLLLERGADPEACPENRLTPLQQAAVLGKVEIVDLLLKKKVPINTKTSLGSTPLMTAIIAQQSGAARKLVEAGAIVDCRDQEWMTPLHFASGTGQLDVVKTLIAAKAQLMVRDRSGWTPLHHAVQTCQKETVALLLENGADPLAEGDHESTPLSVAERLGNTEIIALLRARANLKKGPGKS